MTEIVCLQTCNIPGETNINTELHFPCLLQMIFFFGNMLMHGRRQLPQKGGSKYVLAFATSVEPDQPAHPRSLIRVYTGRYIQ